MFDIYRQRLLTLQTIELNQSVGSFTSVMMSSAIVFSSSALYSGIM